MASPVKETKSPVQVIERLMKLLDLLTEHPEPLGLKQISQFTGLHPSTAHRILNAMPADRMKPQWWAAGEDGISNAIGHVPGVRIGTH